MHVPNRERPKKPVTDVRKRDDAICSQAISHHTVTLIVLDSESMFRVLNYVAENIRGIIVDLLFRKAWMDVRLRLKGTLAHARLLCDLTRADN